MPEQLHDWKTIRTRFQHTLILGNGASIAVNSCFSYQSLYDEASKSQLLNAPMQRLFDRYATRDFEFALRLVWRAHQVNSLFGIDDEPVASAYSQIRNSLIGTVRKIHVDYAQAVDHLPSIAGFMSRFKNVVSLTYDLLVYWAMLHGNNSIGGPWFKDCFINKDRTFADDFSFLRQPYGKAMGATLVFYPHGNLVLATDLVGQIVKICSDEQVALLETIMARWNLNDSTPLFVSEGSSEQKLQAVHRNSYLRTIYDGILRNLAGGPSVCVYGWSMSDQDLHILEALGQNRPREMAVSVYTASEDWEEFCEHVRTQLKKVYGFKYCDLLFFDSQSEGCWLSSRPMEE